MDCFVALRAPRNDAERALTMDKPRPRISPDNAPFWDGAWNEAMRAETSFRPGAVRLL